MKFFKFIAIFLLCLFLGTCVLEKGELNINIGDYDNQLAAWNSQNMLDYQLYEAVWFPTYPETALITVRNGISNYNNLGTLMSTVSEAFSYIKKKEKNMRLRSLNVSYDTEYHYPSFIIEKDSRETVQWLISLMPLEEGELEIDTGDNEAQLAAWNSQNMFDYRIEAAYSYGKYDYKSPYMIEILNVKNGISDKSLYYFRNKKTIPEIYSFIKEEEERIRDAYNGINRSYLNVEYDTAYHYPVKIISGVDHLFGSYWCWEITLTPLGEN
jgi:hypothetical protein